MLPKNSLAILRSWVFPLAGLCLLLGSLFSKFLVSLAPALLLLAALAQPRPWLLLGKAWRHPVYKAFLLFFLVLSLSALLSEDSGEAWTRLRISLPLGLLPLAFVGLPPLSQKHWDALLQILVGILSISLVGVLINYALHFEEIQDALSRSKSVPVPGRDHIRFSLLLCLASFAALRLGFSRHKAYFALALFLFVGLHILSVRSGLLAAYLGIAALGTLFLFRQKRYLLLLGLYLSLASLPFIAYQSIASFRAKIELTLLNFQLYKEGTVGEYSDTRRWLSYQIAWELIEEKPLLGWGLGDMRSAQEAVYSSRYPEQSFLFPHNQFLSYWLGLGLVGLFFFLYALAMPLLWKQGYAHADNLLFHTVLLSSFLTENTLFISIGTGIYCFGCFALIHKQGGEAQSGAGASA